MHCGRYGTYLSSSVSIARAVSANESPSKSFTLSSVTDVLPQGFALKLQPA